MIDPTTYQALSACIQRRVPYVLFRDPSHSRYEFYSGPSLLEHEPSRPPRRGFFVSEFNHKFADCHWIPFELTAEQTLDRLGSLPANVLPELPTERQSTDPEQYRTRLTRLIERLQRRKYAKVVVSRVLVEDMDMTQAADMAVSLLEESPNDFFSCYYHPQTGFWAGATPETLIKIDLKNGWFQTMALAGTVGRDEEWDEKNQLENEMVARFISQVLDRHGVAYNQLSRTEVTYGSIKHLCAEFRGVLWGKTRIDVLDDLNPTPALCGLPRDYALRRIAEAESHRRRCYGGYVGYRDQTSLNAYVNIRCFCFDASHICYYGGGGILAQSDPEKEWAETENKINNIKKRLSRGKSTEQTV